MAESETNDDDDIYEEGNVEGQRKDDMISSQEAGFMEGKRTKRWKKKMR